MQRIKVVEAADMSDMLCTCKTQSYIMGMLTIITLGMLYLVTNHGVTYSCSIEKGVMSAIYTTHSIPVAS